MDWLQFLSSVIGSLAWPGAVVWIAVLVRDPLAKLILRLRTVKYGELHLDISEQIDAVKEEVEANNESPSPELDEPPVSFKALAKTDPRAAVLSAWIPIEIELNEIALMLDVGTWKHGKAMHSPLFIIGRLKDDGYISPNTYKALDQLRRIRNSAVHAAGEVVTVEDAMNMSEVCQRVIGTLRQIKESLNT